MSGKLSKLFTNKISKMSANDLVVNFVVIFGLIFFFFLHVGEIGSCMFTDYDECVTHFVEFDILPNLYLHNLTFYQICTKTRSTICAQYGT